MGKMKGLICLELLLLIVRKTSCSTIKSCEIPNTPENGEAIYDSTNVGAILEYKCKRGYNLKPNYRRQCTSDGQWNGVDPVCEAVSCEIPKDPKNGRALYLSLRFGSILRYQCDESFIPKFIPSRVCRSSGSWSGKEEVCEATVCKAPVDPVNGKVILSNTLEVGSELKYECNENFILILPEVRKCTKQGDWSGEEPLCIEIACNYPEKPKGGNFRIIKNEAKIGSIVVFSCNIGNTLEGSESAECLNTGNWSNETPKCIKNCEPPASVDNAEISNPVKEPYSLNTTVSYQCDSGYVQRGTNNIAVCVIDERTKDSVWSQTDISCIPRSCGDPGNVEHAQRKGFVFTFPNAVEYVCDEGYRLTGRPKRYCLPNGQWSDRLPSCKLILCDFPPELVNGKVSFPSLTFGSTLRYECNEGYTLKILVERSCTADGSWSGKEPICEEAECKYPEAPGVNMYVGGGKITAGRIATFSCSAGKSLVGSSILKCRDTGEWSSDIPKCLDICNVTLVQNGIIGDYDDPGKRGRLVRFQKVSIGTKIDHGKTLTVRCNSGYETVNQSIAEEEISCEDGKWYPEPICIPAHCQYPPPILPNGVVEKYEEEHDSIASYKCNESYKLVGEGIIVCKYGTWKGTLPACIDTRCYMEALRHIPGLMLSDTEYLSSGKSFMPSCEETYEMSNISDEEIYCRDGKWSGNLTPCIKGIICNEIQAPVGGNIEMIGEEGTIGSSAVFTCNPGRKLVGNSTLKCTETGEWTSDPPTCLSSCKVMSVVNGIIGDAEKRGRFMKFQKIPVGTKVDQGLKLKLKCNQGYESEYQSQITCEDGNWSPEPICAPAQCRYSPPAIANGFVEKHEEAHGGFTYYNCNDFYQLVYNVSIVCNFGIWKGTLPVCKDTRCYLEALKYTPGLITENVEYLSSGESFTPSCNQTYEMANTTDQEIYCTEGEWSGNLTPCIERRVCSDLEAPVGGNIEIVGGKGTAGSSVVFICNPGRKLVGNSTSKCTETGEWTSEPPACLNTCKVPLVTHGSVHVLERKESFIYFHEVSKGATVDPGKELIFKCNQKYELANQGKSRLKVVCDNGELLTDVNCTPAKCRYVPPALPNGHIEEFEDAHDGSVVYNCNDFFTLESNGSVVCKFGIWTGELPNCKDTRCYTKDISDTPGLLIDEKGIYLNGESFLPHCRDGYELVQNGSELVYCNEGEWEGNIPPCQDARCQDPPPQLNNGRALYYDGENGSSVIYVCDEGYSLEENSKVQCLDRKWIGTLPLCKDTRCHMRSLSKYSGLVLDEENFLLSGQSFTPECEEGTEITGESDVQIHCRDGEWTGNFPPCKEANCLEPPPEPENGRAIQYTGQHGTNVTYECNVYYYLENAKIIECVKGNWKGEVPLCKDSRCYLEDLPKNEGIQLKNASPTLSKKTANIQCEDGYQLTFQSPICSHGTWKTTAKYSPCQPRSCQVKRFENGVIKNLIKGTSEDYDYWSQSTEDEDYVTAEISSWIRNGQNMYVYCEPPYSFGGKTGETYTQISCSKGNWEPLPECLLTEPVTSGVDAEIVSTTSAAEDRKGQTTIILREEITSTPVNVASDCFCKYTATDKRLQAHFGNELLWQESSIPDGFSITFHCRNIGYDRLIGSRINSCVGCKWESAFPICRGPKDDSDVAISVTARPENNTSVAPGGVLVVAMGTQLNISCYALNSEEEPFWNRAWENQHFETVPEYDAKGNFLKTSKSNTYFIYSAIHSDSGIYECTVNYGKPHYIEIEVEEFLCPEIPKDESIVIHYEGNREINSKVSFWCTQPGKKIFGSETVTCLPTGEWSEKPPTCEDLRCPEIELDESLIAIYNGNRQLYSTASFLCSNPEFGMTDPPFVSCLPYGNWSHDPPICIDLSCPELSLEDHVRVTFSNARRVNSVARFYCSDLEQVIKGSCVSTCLPTREWSEKPPTCEYLHCPVIEVDDSLHVTYDNQRKVQSAANFRCSNFESVLKGPVAVFCLSNGSWSGNPPTCLSLHCPEITTDNSVEVTYDDHRLINSTASFRCLDPKTRIDGPITLTCLPNGEWSDNIPPKCKDLLCPEILTDDLLTVMYLPSREIFSTAVFHCSDLNMKLIGAVAVTCLENGEWSEEFPTCKHIECPDIPEDYRLKVRYYPNRRITGIVSFRCKSSLKMIGRKTLTCKSPGKWSGKIPSCHRPSEVCSIETLIHFLPRNIVFDGEKPDNEFVPLESVVHLRCIMPGRDLMGSAIATCRLNGRWNIEQCVTGCLPFKAPPHSNLIVKEEKDFYVLGDFVTFSCPPGKTLTTEIVRVMCLNGGWSNTKLPQCVVTSKGKEQDMLKSVLI